MSLKAASRPSPGEARGGVIIMARAAWIWQAHPPLGGEILQKFKEADD
jgi:hypothetical protein